MSRKVIGFLTVLLFLTGVLLVCWTVGNCARDRQNMQADFHRFQAMMEAQDAAVLKKQRSYARWYNVDVGGQEKSGIYPDLLSFGNLMGYLYIPCMDTYIPIYHDGDENVLDSSVEHLSSSALPIGGSGNHTVLHDPRANGVLKHIDRLRQGDRYYLFVLNDILVYEVRQVREAPSEAIRLRQSPQEDLCSLTAYVTRGLGVRWVQVLGERLDEEEEASAVQALGERAKPTEEMVHRSLTAALAALMLPLAAKGTARIVTVLAVLTRKLSFVKKILQNPIFHK